MKIIECKNINKSFDNNKVLQMCNLTVNQHDSYCLLGRSGMGKSVLFRIMTGLLKSDSGSVIINKNEEQSYSAGVVFQNNSLIDYMTVTENITFVLMENNIKKADAINIAHTVLSKVGIDEKSWNMLPLSLSGGMKKRVSIARALALKPSVLFFDEPTTGLDPITTTSIANLILQTIKKFAVTVFTITHDINFAVKISNKIGIMDKYKISWEGDSEEFLFSKDMLPKLFRGEIEEFK